MFKAHVSRCFVRRAACRCCSFHSRWDNSWYQGTAVEQAIVSLGIAKVAPQQSLWDFRSLWLRKSFRSFQGTFAAVWESFEVLCWWAYRRNAFLCFVGFLEVVFFPVAIAMKPPASKMTMTFLHLWMSIKFLCYLYSTSSLLLTLSTTSFYFPDFIIFLTFLSLLCLGFSVTSLIGLRSSLSMVDLLLLRWSFPGSALGPILFVLYTHSLSEMYLISFISQLLRRLPTVQVWQPFWTS